MADLQSITLKNVELRWAHLAEPSTKGEYASNKYEVFVVMDKDTAKAVKEFKNPSQDIKELEDGLYGLTLKTSVKPIVMNRSKEKLSDGAIKGIGNGTKAIVKANQYVGFKGKIYLGLQAVMVTDYKEYVSDPFDDIDIDDVASSDDDDLL